MQDSDDLNHILAYAIYDDVGKGHDDQFARAFVAAWTTTARESLESADRVVNGKGYAAGGRGSSVFFNVVANICEIACRAVLSARENS